MTSGKRNPDVRENPRVYSGSINPLIAWFGLVTLFELVCCAAYAHISDCWQ